MAETSERSQEDIDAEVRGLLRQISEEVRNLDQSLHKVATSYESASDPAVAAKTAEAPWSSTKATFTRNRPQIAKLFSRADTLIEANAPVREWWGGEITRIANYWSEIESTLSSWAKPPELPAIRAARQQMEELVYEAGALTIPYELEKYLTNYRPGQVLSFEATFSDQLPQPELRQRVLDYLYNQPLAVSGIVDPDNGTITTVSRKTWRRALSWLVALFLAAAIIVVCWLLPRWGDAPGLAAEVTGRQLATAALLVLVGMAGHVAIGAIKDLRRAATDDRRRFTSIGNWILWGHARELQVWVAIVIAGVLAYVVAGTRNERDVLTLLAVGYSGDSLLDLLLPKFEKGVLDRTEKVRAALA